jgi:outer membrane immunogenic protein
VIKKVLLSTVTLVALAGSAFAADLPSRRAPPVYAPPPIPVFSWTGFYIGAQGGYEWGRQQSFAFSGITGAPTTPGVGVSTSGGIGGAHVGYNFSTQSLPVFGGLFGGALGTGGVIGIEGDVDGTTNHRIFQVGGIGLDSREQIEGSVRGRLGVAVDRALFYATGGVAFSNLQTGYTNVTIAAAPQNVFNTTHVGWTVGGGVEYAVTNNWSARVEYRYSDLGSRVDPVSVAGATLFRERLSENRVQGGFSYKFDSVVPPVVARY